jgi:AcrR family transcriptional regulator
MPDASSPRSTQDKLLDAAETLFAQRGYSGASIRAILSEAGFSGQIALVQYHFEHKLGLYRAVWQRALQAADGEMPTSPVAPAKPDDPPQLRLRAALGTFLATPAALGETARGQAMLAIMHQELADPAQAARGLVDQWLAPAAQRLQDDLREIFPGIAEPLLVQAVRLVFAAAQGLMTVESENWHPDITGKEPAFRLTLAVLAAGLMEVLEHPR